MPRGLSLYEYCNELVGVPTQVDRTGANWAALQSAVRWMDRLLEGPRSHQKRIYITATDSEHHLEECVAWWACHMYPLLDSKTAGCIDVDVAALIGPILELRETATNRLRPVVKWLFQLLFSLVDPFWSVGCCVRIH
jgi:hypothetical protein